MEQAGPGSPDADLAANCEDQSSQSNAEGLPHCSSSERQRLKMTPNHRRPQGETMLPQVKQGRKRATPEAPEEVALQPHAAGAAETAVLPPVLADITNTHQRPEIASPGSPPHPMRARTAEPGAALESPGRNRQLFMAQMTPQHMTCNLSSAVVGLGVKHNLQAILVACYPLQKGPPARRHITLCDQHGATG
jgi:hypothetical protein